MAVEKDFSDDRSVPTTALNVHGDVSDSTTSPSSKAADIPLENHSNDQNPLMAA
jgi:hypothetical protein